MSYVDRPPTFFVPGIKGLLREERDYISKRHPEVAKIEGGIFSCDGLRTNYYYKRAQNQKMVIIGLSGANAQFPLIQEDLNYLEEKGGATRICMAMPPVGPNFMRDAEKLIRAFLLDPHSPVNMLTDQNVPVFIAPHSSSNPIVFKLFGEEGTKQKLRKKIWGIVSMAAILDVRLASRNHSWRTPEIHLTPNFSIAARTIGPFKTNAYKVGPFSIPPIGLNQFTIPELKILKERVIPSIQPLRIIFEKYADSRCDTPISKLWPVKIYLAITARAEGFMNKIDQMDLTLGHVRQIQKYSWNVADHLNPDDFKDVPVLMIAGNKDPCTCFNTNKDMADLIKADFIAVEGGGHDLTDKRPEILDASLDRANKIIEARQHMQRAAEYIPPPGPRDQKVEDILGPTTRLRHRTGLAAERCARALYPAAGFLQRFG